MRKGVGLTLVGAFAFISSLTLYIISAVEASADNSFAYGDRDLLVYSIMAGLVLATGIYRVMRAYKKERIPYWLNGGIAGLIGFMGFAYFLSVAIDLTNSGEDPTYSFLKAFFALTVLIASALSLWSDHEKLKE